ncbi:VWA domain-containing protein [Deinococcus psychrotolerans]|uniref:VWA domain-containing protein n=1 Tax=Deinococcus psychrotolerans TaxID=2489213 RepID=A0A3G8YGE0_9DEIO|nr:VWA domain-containing protein [Deinococcus psychrotolerans]AZI44023.1 VWA domain-containing protein [Deinococcus psychrotolerans]
MLTLPKQVTTPAWHQQPRWRKYVTQLFALISRRMNFTCEFRSGDLIAGVIPESRRLIINPALMPIPDAEVRFDPGTDHARRVMLLRVIVAHEAGHVAFSAPKPAQPRLGWVWNALEDERMERLVVRRHPELLSDFAFLGDAMMLNGPGGELDLLNACLVWRWAHDRQDLPFLVKPEDEERWMTCIRPLVEAAWDAQAGEVAGIAQQILNALLEAAASSEMPRAALSADGAGMTETGSTPPAPPRAAPQDHSGNDAQREGAQDGPEGSSDQKSDRSDAGAGEEGAPDEQGEPNTQGRGGSEQGDPATDEDDQAAQGGSSSDGDTTADDPADTEAQDAQRSPSSDGEDSANAPATDEGDQAGRGGPSSDDHGPTSNDPATAGSTPDEPGDPSGTQDTLGTGNTRGQGKGEAETNPSAGKDWASPAGGAGDGLPLPSAPEEDLWPDSAVFELEAHARRLSSVLAPQGTPAHQQRSRSKGRFRYDRYVTGAERYFQRRVGEEKPAPFVLQLLVDTSGSMDGPRLAAAHQAALLLCRAAFLARSDVRVITFNFDAQEVVPLHTPWTQAQQLAHLRASGGTNLAPALELARAYRPPPTHKEVIGIICDGNLKSRDIQRCTALMDALRRERTTPPTLFPLLIGEGLGATETWKSLFGTAVPVLALDDIALTLKRCLTNERRRSSA